MAAASLTIRYRDSGGRIHSISGYANDTTNNYVTMDEAKIAVSGSLSKYLCKSNGSLVDVCFTSDLATPTHIQIQRNGNPTGDILDVTAQLASVVSRPNPAIPFSAGDELAIIQIA